MSDEEAYQVFCAIRWAANDGKPICPKCGSVEAYAYATRKIFKCKACSAQFSATSGTIFASRKLSIRDILSAIAIFVNGAKGHSALQLSRDLDVQYKTAFVLSHKIRESLRGVDHVSGEVEIDGGYFGGYVKPANLKQDRVDRRLRFNQSGKREVVVVMREREGRTLPVITKSEAAALPEIARKVVGGSTVYADESTAWDALHARYETKRINHTLAYSDGEACTNWAESYFARLRRAEIGTHHKIAGPYLGAYANEMAWREDNRRVSNGEQYKMIVEAVTKHPVSRKWKGYWQRGIKE